MLTSCSYILKQVESLKTGYLQIAYSLKLSPRNPLNSLSVCKWLVILLQYPIWFIPGLIHSDLVLGSRFGEG